ncbi:GAF domain protein, partial [Reticulomyxa filosa]
MMLHSFFDCLSFFYQVLVFALTATRSLKNNEVNETENVTSSPNKKVGVHHPTSKKEENEHRQKEENEHKQKETKAHDGSGKKRDKEEFYRNLVVSCQMLIEEEKDLIANLSNISAEVYNDLRYEYGVEATNWCGFYLVKPTKDKARQELVLGPFQGKPACIRIAFGRGVCGTTANNKSSSVVPDVHKFP